MNRLRPTPFILFIMLGVILWGGIHAWGAVYSGWSYWRGLKALVIGTCVVLFLGFWSVMLAIRKRRLSTPLAKVIPGDSAGARPSDAVAPGVASDE